MTLRLTDAPMDDVTNVWVKFDALEIKPEVGEAKWINLADRAVVDLAALTDGTTETLMEPIALPAGQYNWIRLHVNLLGRNVNPPQDQYATGAFCYVQAGGENFPLDIPSARNTGIKLVRPITVPVGGTADFTLDFDLRKSMRYTPMRDSFVMKPVIRMVDNNVVGSLSGTVTNIPVGKVCGDGAVYVFQGAGVTPDDIDEVVGTDAEPLTVVKAHLNMEGTACVYRAAFLEPGAYTLAFTWDSAADDPAVDNPAVEDPAVVGDVAVAFPFAVDATVAGSTNTTQDIALP